MFTLDQIQRIHATVKSGADFPQYVQDLKQLGLVSYDHYLTDGHTDYRGEGGFTLSTGPVGTPLPVAPHGLPKALTQALLVHQQGHTDYPTFCHQAASAGTEKWTVDSSAMTCTYYDAQGRVLVVERIPLP